MGARKDGIKSFSGIKARCHVDRATGCWNWKGAMRGGLPLVWLPGIGPSSMTKTLQHLTDGTRPTRERMLVPVCGNAGCGNPAHRRWGTKREFFVSVMPPKTELQRAKLSLSTTRHRGIPEDKRAVILSSGKTPAELSRELGLHGSTVAKILRRGTRPAVSGSSVFALAGSMA